MSLNWDQANSTLTVNGDSVVLSGTAPKAFSTFRHTVTGQNIIADQPNDVMKFIPGDGIQLNFNQSTDTITFEMDPAFRYGFTGSTGFTGSQGAQGIDGAYAAVGFTGSQGDQGFAGSSGAFGFTGSQGLTGFVGSIGFTGSQGLIGVQGIQGETGFTGSQGTHGFSGSVGITGSTGSTGAQGNTGFTGSKGFAGSVGASGPQGILGPVGFAGSIGLTGAAGYVGSKGNVGFTGSVGIGYTGSKGNQGYSGSQGAQGTPGEAASIGYTGSKGIAGPTGFTGSSGPLGPEGPEGPPGVDGQPGPPGVDGAYAGLGYTGSQGDQGVSGYTGSIGFTGSQGIQGPHGFTGSQGTGYTGSAGDTGFTGSQGTSGGLQEVTDAGNTTTTNITVADVTSTGNIDASNMTIGADLVIGAGSGGTIGGVQSLTINDNGTIINASGTATLTMTAGGDIIADVDTDFVINSDDDVTLEIADKFTARTGDYIDLEAGNEVYIQSRTDKVELHSANQAEGIQLDIDWSNITNPVVHVYGSNDGNNIGLFKINTSTPISAILDEDDMASDSDSAVPTQQSVKAYVDASSGGSYTDSDAIAAITGADLDMQGNKVLFNNVYASEGDLPSASSYHGMFAHVHGTGAAYFAHAGSWTKLANYSDTLDTVAVQALIDAEVQDPVTLALGTSTTGGIQIGKDTSVSTLSGGGIALGQNADASGSQAIAIGIGATGDSNAIAIGIGTQTSTNSVSIGRSAESRTNCVAVGNQTFAIGTATAVGYRSKAGDSVGGTGLYSVALGADSYAQYNHSMHLNSSFNTGTGPSAIGGIVLESNLGRLEYIANSDWVFNAPVKSSEFKFTDGTSMTTAPTGGGGGGAGLYSMESSSAGGTGVGNANLKAWIGCPAASTAVDKVWVMKHNTDDGRVYAIVSYTTSAGPQAAVQRAGFGGPPGDTFSFFSNQVNNLTSCSPHGSAYFPALFQSAETYASVDDIPPIGYDSEGYLQYLGSEFVLNGIYVGSGITSQPTAGDGGVAIGSNAQAALQSVALGQDADAGAAFAIAIGKNSAAPNNFGIAIGENTTAGLNSVALGYNADASQNYTTAIGWSSIATGPGSTALGHECEATGAASIAMGSDSTVTTSFGIAVGYKSDVAAPYGLVLGSQQDLASSALYTVALGNNLNNQTYTHPNAIFIHAGQENSTGVSKIEVREELVEIQAGGSLGINTDASLKWEAANSWTFGSNVTAPGYNINGAGSGKIASTESIILDGANGVVNQTGTFRLANMDTATRNGFTASNGDMIYNTTDGRIQAYQAGTWINLDDGTAA